MHRAKFWRYENMQNDHNITKYEIIEHESMTTERKRETTVTAMNGAVSIANEFETILELKNDRIQLKSCIDVHGAHKHS